MFCRRFMGLAVAAMVLGACEGGEPVFHMGQMVKMKISGSIGMIVYTDCRRVKCRYGVRFPAIQLRTDVALLGRDGPIEFAPVALVYGVREFELEAVR